MFINNNKILINRLIELQLTISTCESMTGGMLSSSLVDVEHSSQTYLGSLITYSKKSKIEIAKIDKYIIDTYGTISQQCANAMAINCQKIFNSDIAISVTGNASLTNPDESKQSGQAFICIKILDKIYEYKFVSEYASNRNEIRNECVIYIINRLLLLLQKLSK